MARDRWIDFETARKLLVNTCDFIKEDESGIADFQITDGREAVLLTIYTNAFFLLNENYKFSFRGVERVFYAREPISIVPQQYEGGESEIIPIFAVPLSKYLHCFTKLDDPKYLFLVNGTKYATRKYSYYGDYYYELDKQRIIKEILQKIKESGVSPSDCVVWISNPDGTFGEDIWEYVSGIILRKNGYFVTYYGFGGDLSAYYIPEYIQELTRRKLADRGMFLEELEMIKRRNGGIPVSSEENYEFVVIEAESSDQRVRTHSANSGVGQIINKYLTFTNIYTRGIVSGPFVTSYQDIICNDKSCACRSVGLISCDENGKPVFLPPEERFKEPSEREKEIIRNVIKGCLLRNLTFDERCELLGIKPTDIKDYFEKILTLEIGTILDKIEEKLES